jgi:1-deoxy-D-xylulose-5-phosphate reductoisomerase
MKRILLIGATGSIGSQTLDVIARHKAEFVLAGMSAHSNEAGLLAAANPERGIAASMPLCLSGKIPKDRRIQFSGTKGLVQMIQETQADIVVNAAAGAAGLEPSIAALESGKDLALANKESIVMAGRFILDLASKQGQRVIPVDSEHAAIFSMVERFGRKNIREVVLTASGGAFRDFPLERLAQVTAIDALAHPTWSMGTKITVDSASMANKGLEVIEAARLFNLSPQEIKVVIHPESRVHSFIRTRDGVLYAQLSKPDMRLPILSALFWPEMPDETIADMDPGVSPVSFRVVDASRYPLLALAYRALECGEGATIAYNAANEIAVAAFMEGSIRFTELECVVDRTLDLTWPPIIGNLTEVYEVDTESRGIASRIIQEMQ